MCGLVGAAVRFLPSAGLQRLAARFSSSRSRRPSAGSAAMQTAVVRCVPTETKLTISLRLGPEGGSQRHLQREQSESLQTALGRIAHNLVKAQAKKTKRGRKEAASAQAPAQASAPPVTLYQGEQPVPGDTSNAEAWQDGAILQVGESRYRVERNPPSLTQLRLPTSILAGFPVCPKVEVEFGEASHSLFEWWLKEASGSWEPAANGRVFTPTNGHIGLKLRLRCHPGDGRRFGAPVELESDGVVEAGPGACTFDSRQWLTRRAPEEPLLRVVSYNILADVYAQTELSRNTLYPYCPPYALEPDYRQNLIKKELSGYNADIICLQEVDKSVFTNSLSPALDAFGFQGAFRIKEKQHEGLATFFRASKYRLLSQHDVTLSEALVSDPLHTEILEKISTNPQVKEKVLQRSTTLQVCVLESLEDSSKKLCIGNTHLYWHPKGGHIRLIQIAIAFRHLQHVTAAMHPGTPVIFCGDFNSTPDTGLYEFVTKGHISADHPDWTSNGEEERCSMSLMHFFKLKSACGEPAYTNYVGGFQGCLDYIFVDMNMFEVFQVIPFPSHEEIICHLALPSVSHPSDHIALICDLKCK
ncbi:2',5'-phosphodiesterase 12 isoform X1 [Hemiscyllium ocellatum]|uniref:2',5'-phosphodiesterase 12 isoform X1 n=1 Tax=Hemiscyllium ocellatum TaxID=170820 RepID=UPI002966C198|nr:2',5'-phosphodiesterase 12 isoform X1 [Hemiscyllium ocellatum]